MNSPNFAADSAPEVGNMDLARRLREGDRPRFLCCLLAPREHYDALLALYTFNLEIARVRLTVSDPVVGQLRLKWWYDAAERLGSLSSCCARGWGTCPLVADVAAVAQTLSCLPAHTGVARVAATA